MSNVNAKDIKNRINSLKNNSITIISEFPSKDNFDKNNYRKCWITVIFVDVANYTKMCDEWNDDIKIGRIVRTFHEGVLDIMKNYGLKHIQIQGDGIFGTLHSPTKNDKNNKTIFNCALDINGYLKYFWREREFRISIALKEELIIVVGRGDEREVVFAGGAVNEAKKIMDNNKKNCILISDIFVYNNKKILYNEQENKIYISGETNLGTNYSNWYYAHWEDK